MPYILHRFLKVSSLKENYVNTIKERTKALRVDLVPKSIISYWVHVAKTMKAVFSSELIYNRWLWKIGKMSSRRINNPSEGNYKFWEFEL